MITTKRGYHTISNGFVTWCFYEQAQASMLSAYSDGDLDVVDELSILKFNNSNNEPISSKWPYKVRNTFDLGEKLKADRLRVERGE